MIDMRPVGYVIGILVIFLGLTMFAPLAADIGEDNGHWPVFAISAAITIISGSFLALASSNGTHVGLDIQKTFWNWKNPCLQLLQKQLKYAKGK